MLAGSSSQSTGIPLSIIYRILRVAPEFINFRQKNIFVFTANPSVDALKDLLQEEALWLTDNHLASISLAIEKHHAQINDAQTQKKMLETGVSNLQTKDPVKLPPGLINQIESQVEKLGPNLYPIGDYEWAVVCKLVMQSGKLLNDLPEVQLSAKTLLDELKIIYEVLSSDTFKKGGAFLQINGIHFQELLIQFIGQLCLLEQYESAAAIHEYIRLAHLALAQRQYNELDESKIAMTLAPGLFEGLGLFRNIIPRTGAETANLRADTQEYGFFKVLMKEMMMAPVFTTPFEPTHYAIFCQKGSVPKLLASASSSSYDSEDAQGDKLPVIIPRRHSLVSRLRHLTISSSSSSSSSRTSEAAEWVPPPTMLPGYALLNQVAVPAAVRSSSASGEVPPKKVAKPGGG